MWWRDAIAGITGLEGTDEQPFHPDTGFGVFEGQLRYRNAPWDYATTIGAALEELPVRVAGNSAAEVSHLLGEIQLVLQGKGS